MDVLQDQLTYYLDQLTGASILDILLVTLIIYAVFIVIRGTRAVQLLRGLVVLAAPIALLTAFIDLPALNLVFRSILPALLLTFPIIFQPELRRALERLGRTGRYVRLFRRQTENPVVKAIASACYHLSQRRHGALIVIEQDTGLQEYIDTGIPLDAQPSPELLLTVFNKNTELHDGAVIVRGPRIAAAACVMPLSTSSLRDSKLGLRHRASLGISEVSDAVVVVVSEESGQISIAHNGRLIRRQDPARLDVILNAFIQDPGRRNRVTVSA